MASASHNASWQPPSYSAASASPSSGMPPTSDSKPSLTILKDRIVATDYQSRTLYELSGHILSGKVDSVGIEKFAYRVKDSDPPEYEEVQGAGPLTDDKKDVKSATEPDAGDTRKPSMLDVGSPSRNDAPRLTYRRVDTYSTKRESLPVGNLMVIKGVSKSAYKTATLHSHSSHLSWRVRISDEEWNVLKPTEGKELWKAEKKGDRWVWKSKSGQELGIESINKGENDSVQPILHVRAALEDKEMDLLIACWVARVNFEAYKSEKEPMSFSKFKRIMSSSGGRAAGIYG